MAGLKITLTVNLLPIETFSSLSISNLLLSGRSQLKNEQISRFDDITYISIILIDRGIKDYQEK
jgi:hypothetical protein